MQSFVKFPSTPHLTVFEGASVRDDKVFSVQDRDQFLSHEVVIEEKIDGANLGQSFDGDGNFLAQNRGRYIELPSSGQWKPLAPWIDDRRDRLFDVLTVLSCWASGASRRIRCSMIGCQIGSLDSICSIQWQSVLSMPKRGMRCLR